MKAPLREKVMLKAQFVSSPTQLILLFIFIFLGFELARAAGVHSAAHQICGWHKVTSHIFVFCLGFASLSLCLN
jgi:hypothetical protein